MRRHRELLAFAIGLVACGSIAIGLLVSRQSDHLAFDEDLFLRTQTPVGSLDTVQALMREAEINHRTFANSRTIQHLLLLSLLLTGVGGLLVTQQVRSEVRRHRESEARLRLALRQVDERVRTRTSELSLANLQLHDALEARAEALSREQQARAAAERANELKDRFLATISHELRTPLNAIVGWVHVLKLGRLNPSEIAHAIDAIDRNAKAQAKLIADLLDVSRMIQGRLVFTKAPTDLRLAVDEAVEAMRPAIEAKGLSLAYNRSPHEVPVLGDQSRLQQIAVNLLSNAHKFTPSKGHIEVDVTSDGVFAQLRVRDSGEGIAPTTSSHLFDPFFQGNTNAPRAGLGLGLAIVKELVELHGGTVDVASRGPGTGAELTVRFAITRAIPSETTSRPRTVSRPAKARKTHRRRPFWRRLLGRTSTADLIDHKPGNDQ